MGRVALDHLVRTLLSCDLVGESSIKNLVDVFGKLHPPTTRINQLAEIISDIREPAPGVPGDENNLGNTEEQVNISVLNDDQHRKKKVKVCNKVFCTLK